MSCILSQSANELIHSADQDLAVAELIAWGVCALVPLLLFYHAFRTLRHGFKIGRNTVLKGTAARVAAAILVLAGIGVSIVGLLVLPEAAY